MKVPEFIADASIYRRPARYEARDRNVVAGVDRSVRPAIFNEGGDTGTSQDGLEQQGYHCEVVSLGNVECTKAGSPTYTCSRGTCIKSPWSLRSSGSSGLPGLGAFLPRR
jgi:hypothetical protein